MIEVSHVSKYFGDTSVLSDVSFDVRDGELFVLLGTSGGGKTTMLKMMNRLLEMDEGAIFIDGVDIRKEKPEILRRGIGYVMQNTGLFPHYNIRENISVVPDLLGWRKERIEDRAHVLLEKFKLPPDQFLNLYPDQLSGGQQQRVGFVRALMANPPIILMDEPLGALDPITRRQIRKEFNQLDELKGKTIVLVTHDIPEAIELGNRIGLIDRGRIQQAGTAIDLLTHPANDFVRRFFEDNRFSYRMKATKICDLLGLLDPVQTPPDEEHCKVIDTNLDLLSLLNLLSATDTPFFFFDQKSSRYYPLEFSLLISMMDKKNAPQQ